MTFYLIFIFLILAQAFIIIRNNTKGARLLFLWLAGIEIFILLGCRAPTVGVDTPFYTLLFTEIAPFNISFISLEKGYLFYNLFLHQITPNPQILLLVTAFFSTLSLCILIYKNEVYVWLSVFLYLTLDQMAFNMTGIRQTMAISILFFAYDFVIRRKLFSFLFCVVLASTFHLAALIFLITYPLTYLKINLKTLIFVSLATVLCFVTFENLKEIIFSLSPRYSAYGQMFYFDGEIKIASIFKTLICGVIFALSYFIYRANFAEIRRGKNSEIVFRVLLYLSLFGFLITLISIKSTIIERAAFFFTFFNILLLPRALSAMKHKQLIPLFCILIMLGSLGYFITIGLIRPGWFGIIPYAFMGAGNV